MCTYVIAVKYLLDLKTFFLRRTCNFLTTYILQNIEKDCKIVLLCRVPSIQKEPPGSLLINWRLYFRFQLIFLHIKIFFLFLQYNMLKYPLNSVYIYKYIAPNSLYFTKLTIYSFISKKLIPAIYKTKIFMAYLERKKPIRPPADYRHFAGCLYTWCIYRSLAWQKFSYHSFLSH